MAALTERPTFQTAKPCEPKISLVRSVEEANSKWRVLSRGRSIYEREQELAVLNKAIKLLNRRQHFLTPQEKYTKGELCWERNVLRKEHAQFLERRRR